MEMSSHLPEPADLTLLKRALGVQWIGNWIYDFNRCVWV